MTALRQRMIEDMRVRNLAPHTLDSYLQQVSQFARHFRTSPEALGPEAIRTYQVFLVNERKLAASSICTAVSALRFLYKVTLKRDWTFGDVIAAPKKPHKLPVVLSPDEVVPFLSCVERLKHRAILTPCYAVGLRISEAVRLVTTDIDSRRMVLRVERGKGQIVTDQTRPLETVHKGREVVAQSGRPKMKRSRFTEGRIVGWSRR